MSLASVKEVTPFVWRKLKRSVPKSLSDLVEFQALKTNSKYTTYYLFSNH